jgi:hypothetical protein
MHRRSVPFHAVFAAAVALSVIAAGCSSSAATQGLQGATVAPGASSKPVASVPVQAAASDAVPPVAGGWCKVTITGGLTTSWESNQDKASVVVSYWLSPAAHKTLSANGESFLLNCGNGDASMSFYTTNGTTAAKFPQAAGSYVINPQGTVATPGTVAATAAMSKGGLLWRVAEPGVFTVTTLDGSKFAGTFQLKIAEVGDDLKLTGKTASVSGTFDFACSSNIGNVCK